jgi:hypothetical protein
MSGDLRFHSKLGVWGINSGDKARQTILTDEVDAGKLLPLHCLAVSARK